MIARLRNDRRGQALLVTIFFLTVLIGAVALTLDVASWYRQQRQAQATADAAALSGAQDLPASPGAAKALAQSYADKNGGGVAAADITLSHGWQDNDTITVTARRTTPGFFARLFKIDSVNVSASASARAETPEQVFGAAPIVVNKLHPLLSGPGCPCFGTQTTLPLSKTGAPGAFGLVNFDPSENNGIPPLALWIDNGYDGYLDLGPYFSDTGAKFNGTDIRKALTDHLGTELLFPVFDTLTAQGTNAVYDIIGWVGFHLTSFDLNVNGNNQVLSGYFTRVIWDGLQSSTNNHLPDFGVYSVSLVK
jgi:putative Flp pilus-assembly TadE/G-like protein